MMERRKNYKRGVTLTELLVVLAIIGLLATIAVPVYVNKMEQAKVSTAKHEVRELANAEEICGIMHGYYVPLNMLDDLPYRSQNRPNRVDDIQNTRTILNPYLINTGIPIIEQMTNQDRIQDDSIRAVAKLYYGWQGPFMNFKRYYLGQGIFVEPPDPNDEDIARDYPQDPWGNIYIMVSEEGIVTPRGELTTAHIQSQETVGANTREFDRMAIVSLGADGSVSAINDDGITYRNLTLTDDIWVYFGASGLRSETAY